VKYKKPSVILKKYFYYDRIGFKLKKQGGKMPMIARDLNQIDITLDNKALNEQNYEDYYVSTGDARGEDPTAELIRKLKNLQDKNLKTLFSGFKGCGKSTELLRLSRELKEDFVIRIFSVRERLDPNNLSISEILIAMMNDLFDFVKKHYRKIKLSDKLLENLKNWTNTIYTEDEKSRLCDTEAGAGVEIKPFKTILRIMGKLAIDFRSGRKFSQITKKEERQTLSELIQNCNLLLLAIKEKLHKVNKKNIIFIIEDLEKIDLEAAENLFYSYGAQLTALDCCVIYTFPISLVFNPRYNIILNEFNEPFELPMIKVHDKNGNDYIPGIESIERILNKRLDPGLMSEEIMKRFILSSGGCLRDLFRMIKLGAASAISKERNTIEEPDFQYGFNKLKNDYFNTISYDERTGLDANDFYQILADCCKSKDKRPPDVKGMMDLKHNLCILGYNNDKWFDVHPVVKELLREKGLLN
jgi:DNA polymerase III delta prime subunit